MRRPELLLAMALLAGCVHAPAPVVAPEGPAQVPAISPAASHLAAASRLATLSEPEQLAEIDRARQRCDSSQAARYCLRLAVLLAEPGVAGGDLPEANRILEDLFVAAPPRLVPEETLVAELMLRWSRDRLRLAEAVATAESRVAALRRRPTSTELTMAEAEVESLRLALKAAEQKLAAVREIESGTLPRS
jgi:hypothetical protein